MEPKRFTLRCAVHLFLVIDGKILVEKRKNREYCNGQYDVIASHILGGESAIDAIIRTAKTEVNIIIDKKDLDIVQVMHQNDNGLEYINYFFITNKYKGTINNNEPQFCERLDWVEFKYPIDNLEDYINEAIRNYFNNPNEKFTFLGWKNCE